MKSTTEIKKISEYKTKSYKIIILGLVLIMSVSIVTAASEKFNYLQFIGEDYIGKCSIIEKCRICVDITLTNEKVCAEGYVQKGTTVDVYPILACKANDCSVEFKITDTSTKTLDYSKYVKHFEINSPQISEVEETIGYNEIKGDIIKSVYDNAAKGNITFTEEITIGRTPITKLVNKTVYVEKTFSKIDSPDFEYDYKEWAEWTGTGLTDDAANLFSLWRYNETDTTLIDAKGKST